ncbi:MAG: RIP metalloprotease RseP, partial [Alphaproteobacteria bacterium]
FVGIFSVLGKGEMPDYKTVGINKVMPDSPAESSGIKTGDIITKITVSGKDYKINNFQDMFVAVQSAGNKKVTINVKRSNENIKMNITPRAYTGSDGKLYYRIGVSGFPPVYTKTSLIETINMGTSATLLVVRMVYDSVVEMFSNGIETDKMGGPIKIAQMSGQSANMGILKLFEFMALLSINLGILNMIPIPVLDGGRLVLLMAEGVIRRPLPEKLVNPIMAISVIFMLSFFIFMIFVDLGIF